MKPLKKAMQKNVELNIEYYTASEITNMWFNDEVVVFTEAKVALETGRNLEEPRIVTWHDTHDGSMTFRIFLSNVKEIKVVLDEYGQYTNKVITNEGKEYYITL